MKIRSFISVDIEDQYLLNKIALIQEEISEFQGIKLVKRENLHLTIRFLGEISLDQIETIKKILSDIKHERFYIKIEKIGAFPSNFNPRVIWIGIIRGAENLKEIYRSIEPKIRKIGIRGDKKGFSPHLTIARVKSKKRSNIAKFIQKKENVSIGTMLVDKIRLKKSILTSKGPIYETLYEKRLE